MPQIPKDGTYVSKDGTRSTYYTKGTEISDADAEEYDIGTDAPKAETAVEEKAVKAAPENKAK